MNKTLTTAFVVIGAILLSALIFGAGVFVGHTGWGMGGYGPAGMMGRGSSNPYSASSMMSNGNTMMGGYGGMMGGYGYQPGTAANVKPLTVDQARQAVEGYLKGLNNPDLEIKEIMVFDNNAYARITEKSTGTGAMELLIDPASLSVFPEYGANMMWNQKYGHMMGNEGMMGGTRGMMGGNGGMMGAYNSAPGSTTTAMTVSAAQAVTSAQQYLDQEFPGYKSAPDADPFYGYYTLDILKDGKPTGMLSVNGYSGQVFFHSWHGNFIEMAE